MFCIQATFHAKVSILIQNKETISLESQIADLMTTQSAMISVTIKKKVKSSKRL